MRSLMLVAWLCVLLVQSTQAIYEDQAGKFDWSVQNLGRVVAVAYGGGDKRSVSSATPSRGASKAAYVATDRRSRALARVDAKSGEIKWRHVLTVGDEIDAIELTNYGLLSVSGSGKFVRLWDIADGSLLWDNAVNAASAVQDVVVVGEDRALLVAARSIVSVNLKDGAITWRSDVAVDQIESTVVSSNGATLYVLGRSSAGAEVVSVEIATGSVSKAKAAIGGQHVGVFKSEDGVAVAVSVTADKITVQSLEADAKSVVTDASSIAAGSDKGKIVLAGLEPSVKHAPVLVLASGKRVYTRIQKTLAVEVGAVLASGGVVTESLTDDATVLHTVASSPAQVEVKTYSFADQLNHLQWTVDVDVELHGGSVAAVFGGCPQRKKESGVPRCRALLVMKDDDLVMTTNDESESAENARHLLWKRDESLANIKEVQWITPAETEIEKQPLKGIPTFFEELQQESERLKQLVEYVVSASSALLEKKQSDQVVSTKREESVNAHFFGFSKYIVILTESGRLTAIRAETNEVAWSIFVGTGYRLFVTRDHPALGAGAELLLVSNTSKLVWIDGDDGRQIDTDEKKAYGNSWVVLLPKRKHSIDEDASLRRPIALVKRDTLEVTILPKTAAGVSHPEAENFFFSRFDEDSRSFVGYTIDKASNSLYQARVVWSVVLPSEQRLVATSRQRDGAVIDSSVTITGDDSLLLKYLNPHMFGFTSEASETLDGDKKTTPVLYVSLVDAITGRVIHRVRHVHGTGPVHMVQSENWVVYTFWNHKEKRTDLVSLSLFDGAVGSHSLNLWKRPAWNDYRSSYDPRAPFVLQKAFIFPGRIETLGVTVTSRGITPQFVLVGLETGQIFKLNRALIDPRQLEKPPTPQEQEEGLMMYTPLIPLHNHLQSMVTYNQTIANIKTIATTPVELESTTLVFAFGLDLFYVRLAPAKAFDVLPPDFNYELLILLCLGFFGATYVLKSLTLRKSLNEAWK